MNLCPFGVLDNNRKSTLDREGGLYAPPNAWPAGEADAFRQLMENWLGLVKDSIWPAWEGGTWTGGAAAKKEEATERELSIAVKLYHGSGGATDILGTVPDIPEAPDGQPRTQEWHYNIEDALVHDLKFRFLSLGDGEQPSYDYRASKAPGSNYLVYDPDFSVERFEQLFWARQGKLRPPITSIKNYFQRPRPWTAATALGVNDFRWTVTGGEFFTHTGIHPSILSGHCIQGILGGCSVFDALLDAGESFGADRTRAIQKYMVDWGDRRVFAGVHYMTDNIASWTLARRLIQYLFRGNAARVEELAVEAIIKHSRVFSDIINHFPDDEPARAILLSEFPEATGS